MKYYLIEVITGDESVAGNTITEYSILSETASSFYLRLANAVTSELYESDMLFILDSEGNVLKNDFYRKGDF